ncbi:MAG: hypothetical protein WKG07_20305 [Hymenobacter sp.]
MQDRDQLVHANSPDAALPPAPGPETPGPDGRGNQHDTRNLPGRADAAPTSRTTIAPAPARPGYAADYGHTAFGGGALHAHGGAHRRAPTQPGRRRPLVARGLRQPGLGQRPRRLGGHRRGPGPRHRRHPAPDAAGEGYGDKGRQGRGQPPRLRHRRRPQRLRRGPQRGPAGHARRLRLEGGLLMTSTLPASPAHGRLTGQGRLHPAATRRQQQRPRRPGKFAPRRRPRRAGRHGPEAQRRPRRRRRKIIRPLAFMPTATCFPAAGKHVGRWGPGQAARCL